MEGDLSLLSIPDLLQMICLGRYNRDIHLYDGPILVGVIAIRQGRIERCIGLGSRGDVAFYKLVGLRRGRYKVHEGRELPSLDATLSGHSWQDAAPNSLEDHGRAGESFVDVGRYRADLIPLCSDPDMAPDRMKKCAPDVDELVNIGRGLINLDMSAPCALLKFGCCSNGIRMVVSSGRSSDAPYDN